MLTITKSHTASEVTMQQLCTKKKHFAILIQRLLMYDPECSQLSGSFHRCRFVTRQISYAEHRHAHPTASHNESQNQSEFTRGARQRLPLRYTP